MKGKIGLLSAFGVLAIAVAVLAQTGTTSEQQARTRLQELNALKNQLRTERTETFKQIQQERQALKNEVQVMLSNFSTATTVERQEMMEELQTRRQEVQESIQTLRQNLRENAKLLRENFREKVKDLKQRVRIAVVHGRSLRMLNRFRAAIARFEHILDRLESRKQKIEERGIDASSVDPLFEQAETLLTEAEAKFEELKAKYEELLTGENPRKVAGQGKEIAQELKVEIVKLHEKLKEIVHALAALTPEEESPETATSTATTSQSSIPESNND